MKNGMWRRAAIGAVLSALAGMASCELIMGTGGDANVMLDLGPLFGGERAIAPPAGIAFTRIVVTVFGPGMATVTKTVSAGSRYLNMSVPAGADRHFKIEAFFNIIDQQNFLPNHLRSYIGRAHIDLRPGKFVGLRFNMAAGASLFMVPDYNAGVILLSEDLTYFNPDDITVLGAGSGIGPADIDLSANGTIYSANYSANAINFAANRYGTGAGTIPTAGPVFALAMDRNAAFDIDRNLEIDTSVLYYTTTTQLFFTVVDNGGYTSPQILDLAGRMTTITGMAVDPWDHYLYLTGTCDGGPAIVVYDTFYRVQGMTGGWVFGRILSVHTHPALTSPFDVVVKENAVFVLNFNTGTDPLPSVMRFDMDLNYVKGFGSVSRDATGIVPSAAPGKFYYPLRFFALENDGLFIIDDSNRTDPNQQDFDKVVRINTDLDAASWGTYPAVQPDANGYAGDPFSFFL
jgi:hypothetical protein